jgi:hypothetical protein
MIQNKVYRLKEGVEVAKDMPLPAGQEVEIVMDVVYVNGYPVPPAMQKLFLDYVTNNESKFDDVTKKWK